MKLIELPVKVKGLGKWMPHRPPMLWIDEVLWVKEKEGECSVYLNSNAHYMGQAGIRPSSVVEWVAQAYGFSRVCQALLGLRSETEAAKRAFLAGVKAFQLDPQGFPQEGRLTVQVTMLRELGPLSLFKGIVKGPDGKPLAEGELKVFAQ